MYFGLVEWWTDQSKKKSKMDWWIGNQYIFQAGLGTGNGSMWNGLVNTLYLLVWSWRIIFLYLTFSKVYWTYFSDCQIQPLGPPMNLHVPTYQRDFSGNLVQETLKFQRQGVDFSANPVSAPSIKQGWKEFILSLKIKNFTWNHIYHDFFANKIPIPIISLASARHCFENKLEKWRQYGVTHSGPHNGQILRTKPDFHLYKIENSLISDYFFTQAHEDLSD